MVTIGIVVGLDYRDAELSVHELLQQLKLHPRIRPIVEGGERGQWGAKTIPEGGFAPKDKPTERDAEQEIITTGRSRSYPAPDGQLTFDKLSSVFLSGNRTRDDQPNHIRVQTRVPRELAELWAHMCPAQVYEVGEPAGDGLVEVRLAPSNCVQCGAITAKGGRLTPPEGGSGPEYTLT